jgi:hypothetical protein
MQQLPSCVFGSQLVRSFSVVEGSRREQDYEFVLESSRLYAVWFLQVNFEKYWSKDVLASIFSFSFLLGLPMQ